LEIAYETKEIRDLFHFPARALARYGPSVARMLAVRFADLRALPNAGELVAFSPQEKLVQGDPMLELDIVGDFQMILAPNHPKRPAGPVNWAKISRLKVFMIVGSHEQK
jgi:hypothetical protein